VFVSIHHNAYTGKWNKVTGVEVYTDKKPTAADNALAKCVYTRLVKYTGLKGRGIKKENWRVINQSKIPAILCEGGFMDSSNDYNIITSEAGQTAYARAIAEGLIEFLGLTKKVVIPAPAKKTIDEIAAEVLKGLWGNGSARKDNLTKAGYDAQAVQAKVNELCGKKTTTTPTPAKKTNEQIAAEVLAGKWGNGAERKKRLADAGYNYTTIQRLVNKLAKKK
jgi:hypothetical protein